MKQIIQSFRNGQLDIVDVAVAAPKSQQILVRTTASVLSAGTEKATAEFSEKSLLGKALSRPDLVRQVWQKVKNEGIVAAAKASFARLDVPLPLGYSSAGVVLEVGQGVPGIQVGDRVACAGMGYASHAEVVVVPRNLFVKVPDGVTDEDAAFATLGAIALQGVRVADLRLGEKVAVIGLGLIGLLTVQLLKASGCRVLGSDVNPARLALAEELGADEVVPADQLSLQSVSEFTCGRGVDAVLVTAATSSNVPTETAGEIARHKGRIVFVGDVRMDIPRRIYYKKELDVRLSMSYGPGRYDPQYEEKGVDYPYSYVPFTEQRNMEVFLNLVSERKVTPAKLITHRFALEEAQAAYSLIKGETKEPFLGVVFRYPKDVSLAKKINLRHSPVQANSLQRVNIGMIGAGNYAKQILLPNLKSQPEVRFAGLATSTGISGRHTGEKYGFDYCTTDYNEILQDPAVDAVVIATRHLTHADMTVKALQAGKHVYVEKPLAMSIEELVDVVTAAEDARKMVIVGFNRRFAPLAQEATKFFAGRSQPLCMIYRVNAGFIPSEHWTQDTEEGGGRVLGEVCHFVDFLQFLCGAEPVSVSAIGVDSKLLSVEDHLTVTIRFADGSIGTVHYFANGDKSLPKESIEIFGEGKVFRIDDFRHALATSNGNTKTIGGRSQDKGQANLLKAFKDSIVRGVDSPIPLQESALSTLATLRILESLKTGCAVSIRGQE